MGIFLKTLQRDRTPCASSTRHHQATTAQSSSLTIESGHLLYTCLYPHISLRSDRPERVIRRHLAWLNAVTLWSSSSPRSAAP